MGIHYDYKSTKSAKLMEKQAKREKKLAEKRAKKLAKSGFQRGANPENTNDNCLGIFNNNLDGLLTDLDEINNNPAMYYSISLVDAMAQHQFKIYVIINNE